MISTKPRLLIPLIGMLLSATSPEATWGQNLESVAPYFRGDRILVQGKINEQKIRLIVDTGASYSALFLPAAEKLKIVEPNPPLGENRAERTLSRKFHLALLGHEADVRLPIIPYSSSEPVDGVFAWSNIAAAHLLIDGYERVVTTPKEVPTSEHWQRWKLQADNAQLFFYVTQGQQPYGRVFLDTGAVCGLRVHPTIWEEWKKQNPQQRLTLGTFRYGLGETTVHEMGWARQFQLGDLTFFDVNISPFTADEAEKGGEDYLAMIGILALRNLRVFIDRENNEVLTQSVAPALLHNRLGAVFVAQKDDNGKLIAHVLAGSPADQAGIKNGDELLSIAGLSQLDEGAVNQSFCQAAGTEVQLKLRRPKGTHEIKVVLRDLLP